VVPHGVFVDEAPTPESARAAIDEIRARMAADTDPYPIEEDLALVDDDLRGLRAQLVWAPARIVYDDPSKATDKRVKGVVGEMRALALGAEREILIENAYFVPRDGMVEVFEKLRARGVRIRVLTNSLISNDVAVVHSGYRKYREDLLELGVEIYELRPDSEMKRRWSVVSTRSRAGLHTKAMVIDRRHVVVGSFNLDPRSADINTEAVLLVDSETFGERVAAYLDEGVQPGNSYRVTLEDGDLRWTTSDGEDEIVFEHEPQTGRWQRFVVRLVSWLPIQSQL
jgi:cardiolipin synthase C